MDELTAAQRWAVRTHDRNICLRSGAGCGKTRTLTERFLALLSRPDVTLSELVAITFTEKATTEMRDRIRTACRERLADCDAHADQARFWVDTLRDLQQARISTIHGFCARLLREHPAEAGIDPEFQVLDEVQARALADEVVENELRRLLEQRHAGLAELVTAYGFERVRTRVRDGVRRAHKVAVAAEAWHAHTDQQIVAGWRQRAGELAAEGVAEVLGGPLWADLCRAVQEGDPGTPSAKRRKQEWLDTIRAVRQTSDPTQAVQLIAKGFKAAGQRASYWNNPGGHAPVMEARRALAKAVTTLVDLAAPADADVQVAAVRLGRALLDVTERTIRAFAARKLDEAVLDYDDLLTRTLDCLRTHPELADAMQRQIRFLLVDEFQDTDPVQMEIVDLVCGRDFGTNRLFVVGDEKQSIFRFRGAEVAVFHRLRERIPEAGRRDLNMSFRSPPGLIDVFNDVFAPVFGHDYVPLEPSRAQTTDRPCAELLLAEVAPGTAVGLAREQEATAIADRIARMVADRERRVAEKGQTRPARYGDVAMLFQALSDVATYEKALRDRGIPYYLVSGRAFFAQQEVYDVLNLLRAVENPMDGLALVGALRSPLFGLSDETLFWLTRDGRPLSDVMTRTDWPAELAADQQAQAARAGQVLDYLRTLKDRTGVATLLQQALERTGYDAVTLAGFLGPRKVANLNKIIHMAREFDQTGLLGLADFVGQLEQSVSEEAYAEEAPTAPERGDVVRLMSVHKAKGLQFPVVVIPDAGRTPYHGTPVVHFDSDLGCLLRVPDERGGLQAPLGWHCAVRHEAQQDRREHERLFYVAATRARDYLIISAAVDPDTAPTGWLARVADRVDLDSGEARHPDAWRVTDPPVWVNRQAPVDADPGARSRVRSWAFLTEPDGRSDGSIGPGTDAVHGTLLDRVGPVPVGHTSRELFSVSELASEVSTRPVWEDSAEEEAEDEPGTIVGSRSRGVLVHRALELLALGRPPEAAASEAIAEAGPDGVSEDVAQDVGRLVHGVGTSALWVEVGSATQRWAEVPLLLRLPARGDTRRAIVVGKIDLLFGCAPDTYHLVDYKTGGATPAAAVDLYRFPMTLYAAACREALGVMPLSVRIELVDTGRTVMLDVSEDNVEAALDLAWQAVARRRAPDVAHEPVGPA